ncbi:type VI secretion system tube protein TssD [uncultured Algibacter sp.]|uniref:type VI secretion system tube protein TssD n=1 Tax=uncultured Algibacter sp. TaxID=298659 RepID=UPI0032163122
MSMQAKLYIDELEYNVLNFDFNFRKEKDANGRPTTKYIGGLFNFTVESNTKTDIMSWSIHPTEMKKVKLVIIPNHNNGKTRTIILGDSVCLRLTNRYFSNNNQPLKESFTVSPGYMIQNGQTIFEKNWKVTDLSMINIEPTRISKKEPEIIDCYYTDLEGNEDTELTIGEEVYLVLKTENKIGEIIDLDLSNHSKDFEHNGAILENDLLEDISINSNLLKIKLKIVAPQEEPSKLENA